MWGKKTSRRAVLAKGAAVSAILAGCSGNGGSDTPTATGTATDTATDSPTATPSPTESPTATESPTPEPPTVEDFPYPDGASQSGIAPGTLYTTHRSAITDAGSATVAVEQSRSSGEFSSSFTQTNAFSADGLSRTTERSEVTETLWTPSGESAAYVRMDTGFEQRYRIENSAPRPQELLRLQAVEFLLGGASWTAATEVVELGDEFGVVYDAADVADEERLLRATRSGGTVTEFAASITVTEAGYVRELSYDITTERDGETTQQAATVTTGSLGATSVPEPSWAGTAREDGVRFEASTTDDNRLVALEMVNGVDVPAQTSANLSSENSFAFGSLGQSVSVGDTLYLGISGGGELLAGVNQRPDGGTDLGRFVFISLDFEAFTLFDGDIQ